MIGWLIFQFKASGLGLAIAPFLLGDCSAVIGWLLPYVLGDCLALVCWLFLSVLDTVLWLANWDFLFKGLSCCDLRIVWWQCFDWLVNPFCSSGDCTAVIGSLSDTETWVAKKLTHEHNSDNQNEVSAPIVLSIYWMLDASCSSRRCSIIRQSFCSTSFFFISA